MIVAHGSFLSSGVSIDKLTAEETIETFDYQTFQLRPAPLLRVRQDRRVRQSALPTDDPWKHPTGCPAARHRGGPATRRIAEPGGRADPECRAHYEAPCIQGNAQLSYFFKVNFLLYPATRS